MFIPSYQFAVILWSIFIRERARVGNSWCLGVGLGRWILYFPNKNIKK